VVHEPAQLESCSDCEARESTGGWRGGGALDFLVRRAGTSKEAGERIPRGFLSQAVSYSSSSGEFEVLRLTWCLWWGRKKSSWARGQGLFVVRLWLRATAKPIWTEHLRLISFTRDVLNEWERGILSVVQMEWVYHIQAFVV
jgi:hypothetical protein